MTAARALRSTIDFAEGLTLPAEVASSPIAFLAQRGRGKTRGAKGLAEAFKGTGSCSRPRISFRREHEPRPRTR